MYLQANSSNGINLGTTKVDLLDRGLIIELEYMPMRKASAYRYGKILKG
jgi:hypothetical protein